MKRRELVRYIEEHGCVLIREGHSHSIYENSTQRRKAPVPRHREIPDPLAKVICRQLGVPTP